MGFSHITGSSPVPVPGAYDHSRCRSNPLCRERSRCYEAGIVAVSDDVIAGGPVQIVDERHKKPLAIGVALMDGSTIRASAAGKMCKNFHHVGDELWNLEL